MKNGQSPSLPHLLAAAELALIYGKCSEAEVQYTQIRNLRSLPGTVAGVLVHEEKVLKVRRNEGALLGWQPTE